MLQRELEKRGGSPEGKKLTGKKKNECLERFGGIGARTKGYTELLPAPMSGKSGVKLTKVDEKKETADAYLRKETQRREKGTEVKRDE